MLSWYKFKKVPQALLKPHVDLTAEQAYDLRRVTWDDFTPELQRWFTDLDVTVDTALIFYRDESLVNTVHTDTGVNGIGPAGSINIELVGNGGMFFYKPGHGAEHALTPIDTPYAEWADDGKELELADKLSFEPSRAYLVRTDIPHVVSLNTPKRVLLAVRFRIKDEQFPSWRTCVEHLHKKLHDR